MRTHHALVRIAVCAATLGLLIPGGALQAAETAPSTSRRVGSDVILTQGTMSGQILTSSGAPLDGARVSIRQGGRELAQAMTDTNGLFSVSGLNTGTYEVAAGDQLQIVRAWDSSIAPPSANEYATIVSGTVVRGEDGTGGGAMRWVVIGGIVTGIVLGTVFIVQHNNNNSHDGLSSP